MTDGELRKPTFEELVHHRKLTEELEDRAVRAQEGLALYGVPMQIGVIHKPGAPPELNIQLSAVYFVLLAELLLDQIRSHAIEPFGQGGGGE